MKYRQGNLIVSGNPSINWIIKMTSMGMIFTIKNGQVVASFERNKNEKIQNTRGQYS